MNWLKLVASLVIIFLAAFIGSAATTPNIPTWYASLEKPFFAPPNWVFGPVWTTLYVMMAASLYLVWNKGYDKKKVRDALNIFWLQLVLNTLWSIVAFGMRSLAGGFFVIVLLWLAIFTTMHKFWHIDKRATWLLLPYICWVTFASVANFALWVLNP